MGNAVWGLCMMGWLLIFMVLAIDNWRRSIRMDRFVVDLLKKQKEQG